MKVRVVIFLLLLVAVLGACSKNDVSKIPNISLVSFQPNIMKAGFDTCVLIFSIVDGDGDIGNDSISQIYLKDSRFDSLGFVKTPFPYIDPNIEDPKKGIQSVDTFYILPPPITRPDSLHTTLGDTLTYEMYIKDRAGHESNHVTTHQLIIRP